jgi:hypothetical protein
MDPYVWAFPRDGGEARRKAPQNIFTENDLYTNVIDIPGHGDYRDLRIENGLKEIEDGFYRVRDEFVRSRKIIPMVPLIKLLAYVAAQQCRTPDMREHYKAQWKQLLDITDDVHAASAGISQESRAAMRWDVNLEGGGTISREKLADVVERPLQNLIVPAIQGITPALTAFQPTILCAAEKERFITSDAPVVWFDPEAYKRPEWLRSPAVMYPKTEVTLPIDPNHLLLLSHYKPEHPYIDIGDRLVTELNRRTRAHTSEFFVACSPHAKMAWYDPGSPPA